VREGFPGEPIRFGPDISALNLIVGESSSDSLDEAFPDRIEALLGGLAILVGARQRDYMGKHNQAPRQVLGVVTLHAICEEWHVVVTEPVLQVVWTGPWPTRPCP
jgi:hypothetical protein